MNPQNPPSVSVQLHRLSRRVLLVALASTLLALAAFAGSANAATTRGDLGGQTGFCPYGTAALGAAVGKGQITTTTATSPGFHSVRVDVKLRAHQVPAGTYQVSLVNLYRDDAGEVSGCSATSLASPLTVGNGGVDFHGSVTRYTGSYELQVYVGPIFGLGYATAPALVDVP
jgi:hypothetical protein